MRPTNSVGKSSSTTRSGGNGCFDRLASFCSFSHWYGAFFRFMLSIAFCGRHSTGDRAARVHKTTLVTLTSDMLCMSGSVKLQTEFATHEKARKKKLKLLSMPWFTRKK
jgi:hypothetical protein